MVGLKRGLDLLGVKHEANRALFRGDAGLGDLAVERGDLPDPLRCFRHQLQVLITPLGDPAVLSLDGLPQPRN